MTRAVLAFVSVLLVSMTSQAYFVATLGKSLDPAKTTRILLSGRGTDLGLLPQLSALGRARLYQRNFPEHQIVLISVFENESNEARLVRAGWTILIKNDVKLETNSAVAAIMKFKKIRSFDLFGHNSPSIGTQTDGKSLRFDPTNPIVDQLGLRFDSDSYVIFHGCNSGWRIAQSLSRRWRTAVAGSFNGTRFEHLHTDGHFYVHDAKWAPNTKWERRNDDLGGMSCEGGGCVRMRPEYTAYRGKWGDFSGPIVTFFKFFCPLETGECQKRMAESLFGFLAEKSLTRYSTAREFADVAKEYFCPVYKDRKITNECLSHLEAIERGQGNPLQHYIVGQDQLTCDLKSCTGKMRCDDHKCTIEGRVSVGATTMTQEYLNFLKGFELLKAEGF